MSSAIASNTIKVASNSLAPPPTVDFDFDNNTCSGQSVSFISIVTGDGGFEYTWDFGDGSTSTQQNPNHTFQALGCGTQNFNVTLTVTDINGLSGTDTQTVTIRERPDISFVDTNPGVAGDFNNCGNSDLSDEFFIELDNESTSLACIGTYNINWGDGDSQSNVSFPISHNYIGFGTYNMQITAIGDNGCTNTITYSVKNASNPSGGLATPGDTLNLCAPTEDIQFVISTWGENTSDTTYEVDYGDGTTVLYSQIELEASIYYNASNPSASIPFPIQPHSYTETSCPDEFVARLWIRNACAPDPNPATVPNIRIIISPDANFTAPETSCVNTATQFINITEPGFGFNCSSDVDFIWDFGDGSAPYETSTYENVNHTYTSSGTYTVTLIADNNICDVTEYSQTICIEGPLNPTFTTNNNEGCVPYNTVLNNTTNLMDQCDIPTYEWVINYTASFCGTSSGANFINGTDSNSVNPEIDFTNPGTYELVLQATNLCGTTSSLPQEIIVKSPPQVTINGIDDFCETASIITPSATVDNCGPNNATYIWSINVGTSPTDWEFINGTDENSPLPEISFYTPNTYFLNLEVTNSCGSNTDNEEFIFSPVPSITNVVFEQIICSGTSTEEIIFESSYPNSSYDWSGSSPSGNISGIILTGTTDNIPSHILTLNSGTSGTVVYSVTPFLVDSCPGDPFQFTITINEGPSIATQPVGSAYCIDGSADVLTFTLNGNSTGTINYQWYYNTDGNTDPIDPNTEAVPSPEGEQADYQPPTDTLGTFYYFCIISFSGSGSCSEIATIPVAITVTPNVVISNEEPLTQIICAGADAGELSFTTNSGGAGVITLNWFLSDDNVIDGTDTQVGTTNTYDPGVLNTSGTYYYYATVDVDESLGCSDVSSEIFSIEVLEDPEVTITPVDQTICTNIPANLLVAQVSGGIDINTDGTIDNADYEFQWFLNSNPVTETNNSDADVSTFNHDSALPAGVYNYYCEISQPNGLDCDGTSNTVTITVNEGPSIVTQPLDGAYCIDGVPDVLTFVLSGNVTGTPTYQWYYNTDGNTDPIDPNTIAVASPEGIQVDYLPPTDTEGTLYYFCVISFSGTGSCSEIFTTATSIEVVPNVVISGETPVNQTICSGASASELSFTTSSGGTGTITYNWYSSNDAVIDASDIPVGTNATIFNPGVLNTSGTYYYYATVDVDESLGCLDVSSEIFSIEVVEDPEVTITPVDQTICTNVSANLLVAQVSGGIDINTDGTIDNADYEFQWFLNSNPVTEANDADGEVSTFDHDSALPAGVYNYYCEISQPNGLDCNGTSNTVTITVNEGPSIVTQPLDGTYCIDGVPNVLTFVLSGNVTGNPTYQWYYNTDGNTGPTDPNTIAVASPEGQQTDYQPPTDTEGTLYYFCVISFSGTGSCSEIFTTAASIEVVPNVVISGETPLTQTICSGASASELSFATNNQGTGTITYNWYSSNDAVIDASDIPVGTNATIFNIGVLNTSGTYYYYATVDVDESLGCLDVSSEIFSIEVVEDPEVIIAPVDQTICTNVPANLLVAQVSGGIDINNDGTIDNADYEFQWFLNSNPVTEANDADGEVSTFDHDSVLPAGVYNYYCEISQPNGLDCDGTSNTVTITVNEGPSIAAQPVGDEYCLGDTINSLEVVIVNGVGVPNYQWYSNDTNDTDTPNLIGTDSNILNILNTNVGLLYYYCVITFSNGGCGDLVSEIVAITINQVPEISNYEVLICSNNSFTVIPDNTNGDVVPLNTTYTWTIPTINPVGAITGASEEMTPVNEISQFLENTTINPASVTYTVTPISGDCVGVDFEVVVTVNPSILVTAIPLDNDCFESNNASIEITVVGGVPFANGNLYNITWTGPNGFSSTDEDIFNLEIGTYLLNIEDDGGCPYSETFTISEPEILVFGVTDFDPQTISCFGANDGTIGITVEGGTSAYTYSWTLDGLPFSANEDLSNLGPGTYEITATDVNNCGPIIQNFLIEEPPLLVVSLDAQTNVLCFGESTGAIAINVVGGRPDYIYSWIGPSGFTSVNQNIDSLIAGTYTITVTDDSGCTDLLDLEIIQNDEITIDITTTEIECYGDNDASITINNITGGVSPYDISWSNFGTGNNQTNLSAGTYTITITDSENCSRDFPIIIEEAPIFLIDPVVTQMSCSGENDASIVLNFVGGIAPVTVVWNDDASAGVERNNLAPGTYSVTITDGTPCTIEDSFTIFNILPLEVSANVTNALDCDDTNSGAINLLIEGGTPPFSFIWSNGETTEDLENSPPNNYTVLVTDFNGCEIEGSWTVNRFEPLAVLVDTQSEVDCEAQIVNQIFVAIASGGVPPFQFNWSSGTVSGTNNELMTTDENGLVILEVIDSLGCSTNFSFNVETPVLGDPDFDTSSFGFINYGVFAIQDPIQFTNTATGDYVSVLWDFGDGSFSAEENPIHSYLQVGNYVVTQTVTYPFGCVYTKIVTLIVEKGYQLIMPDAFTPNEDGLNDFFGPEYIGLDKLELNIYDTWGSLVYSESGDDIRGWDGKINDEEAENGNYYYTFSASTFYEDVIEKQGAFVFIK
ncbi:PKD domain-containing protein [Psychroserpens burtonensis]|nr:PKD domain-containing protein [Psychroserpens burtonensis]